MPETAPHYSWSSTSKGHKVGPNWYLCATICMFWSVTTEGEYKDDQMTSTQLDSHTNMVVVGKYSTIINRSVKSANVRPFSSDCSKLEAIPIVEFPAFSRQFSFPYGETCPSGT